MRQCDDELLLVPAWSRRTVTGKSAEKPAFLRRRIRVHQCSSVVLFAWTPLCSPTPALPRSRGRILHSVADHSPAIFPAFPSIVERKPLPISPLQIPPLKMHRIKGGGFPIREIGEIRGEKSSEKSAARWSENRRIRRKRIGTDSSPFHFCVFGVVGGEFRQKIYFAFP